MDLDEVVSATAWRTHLLIATLDGARLWALSDGEVEWVLPPHFTDDDLRRLSAWLLADAAARSSGDPTPAYIDFMRRDAPRMPLAADEMAGLIGWPPGGLKLQQLLDECQGVSDE